MLSLLSWVGRSVILKKIPESIKTEDFFLAAARLNGEMLEYVPDKYKTKELFFEAVKQDGRALKFVDVGKLTKEEYAEICRLSLEGRSYELR